MVTHTTAFSNDTHAGISGWLNALSGQYSTEDIALIQRACEFAEPLYADHVTPIGTLLMQHVLGTATLLASMQLDTDTLAATVLYGTPKYLGNWTEQLQTHFGSDILNVVTGIAQMERVRLLSETGIPRNKNEAAQQTEGLRKMLLAMVQDIRVVLIKLAERTYTMRHLSGASAEQQQRIAHEVRNIFAPLANRLGVWQLKWELEDLSVRYLDPALYKKIASLLDARRIDRDQYIADVVAQLRIALQRADITADVSGRAKHIYSIINKMKRKQMNFSDLYDVRAVRILTENITQCYAALSVVHELWTPITSEFDDYIAHPKSNNYRSLHTAVVGPRGLALEVQIRTREMHHYSELGVAAHWRYKEGSKSDAQFDEKIAWLRQLLEWRTDVADRANLQQRFSGGLLHDQIYVFTPQGKVIALPPNATPVDFAYALHSGLGHRTRGAKVDGNIVPLSYTLQNGQRVEILTTKQGAPSRDWLNPALGFLHSTDARASVRAWFRKQQFDQNVAQGKIQLDKELHRSGTPAISQEKIAQRLGYNKPDDLLAAIGRNEINVRQITSAIRQEIPGRTANTEATSGIKPSAQHNEVADITVGNVKNVMTRLAKCCNPTVPDHIIGYITRDRGITIHHADCPFMQRLSEHRPERTLTAQWGNQPAT